MNRREALKATLGVAAASYLLGGLRSVAVAQAPAAEPFFKLPPLGYAYGALEPYIDTATMTIHHQNHHQAYINNVNAVVDKYPDLTTKPIEEILSNLNAVPEPIRATVRNNLGGHYNHTFFWDIMTPGGAQTASGDLQSAIDGAFGSFQGMQDAVTRSAMGRFGSGWAWLAIGPDKKLIVLSSANQDTPLESNAKPVVGIDVWEHAYYLKHQYRRADYVKAWWNTVNWGKAAANFKRAVG